MNNKDVGRTAMATPGLSIINYKFENYDCMFQISVISAGTDFKIIL